MESEEGALVGSVPEGDGDWGGEVVQADHQADQPQVDPHLDLHHAVEDAEGQDGEHPGGELAQAQPQQAA